jgi:glycosyltransferase involved in cell wall biosynthesis
VEHYLLQGADKGFDPGPFFSSRGYFDSHFDVAQAGMNPLVHFLRYGQFEGRFPRTGNSALGLEEQLWAGLDAMAALAGLRLIAANSALPEPERIYAAWALVRWHGARGEWSDVEPLMVQFAGTDTRYAFLHALPLVEVDALIKSGKFSRATARLEELVRKQPTKWDFFLAKANLLAATEDAGNARLECLNSVLNQAGLAALSLKNPAAGFNLDNMSSNAMGSASDFLGKLPLVSILVPVFNAEMTISTALESLEKQSWQELEVLVIDDCSTDRTAAIAESFVHRDSRFRLLRTPFCQGAYVARNLGLAEAKGEFLTVHDADDWSHPAKIALQVECLLQDPNLAASVSHWVRCTDDMHFGGWRIEDGWIQRNVSSLMLRRVVHDVLGYWDQVKVSADTEYYYRVLRAFGNAAIAEVLPGVPLSFGRVRSNSLTGAGETHERTALGGVRKLYLDAAQNWHRQSKSAGDLYLPARPEARPFASPPALRCEVREWQGMIPMLPGRRNILIVAHAASRQLFGAERCLADVARGLSELGANVIVALPEAENPAYLNTLRNHAAWVFTLPYSWWRQGRNPEDGVTANFRQLIVRFEIDLVYANTLVLWEPLLAARGCAVRTLVHVHELPEHDPELCSALGADAALIRQHALALSDTLVANSQLVAQWLNAPERTVIVPNTLDFSRFDLSLRSEGTSLNVALISSNIPKKGLQDFVTLARQLSIATDFRLACLLIGPENGHVAALRQGQASGEIAENLHFFGMASDPLVALAEADIVLNLSSFQESFGRVVLEAMAARRPVVCYDWGALSELVVDGETGFLTPYGKVDAVADAVLTLAANPALRSRMGEAGRTRAMALCGWPVFLEQLQCSINPFQE